MMTEIVSANHDTNSVMGIASVSSRLTFGIIAADANQSSRWSTGVLLRTVLSVSLDPTTGTWPAGSGISRIVHSIAAGLQTKPGPIGGLDRDLDVTARLFNDIVHNRQPDTRGLIPRLRREGRFGLSFEALIPRG